MLVKFGGFVLVLLMDYAIPSTLGILAGLRFLGLVLAAELCGWPLHFVLRYLVFEG
jgi:hypothetical protein